MVNKVDIWKDAPEGTEFIVELEDGEIHYYKTVGVTLCVISNGNGDEWRTSFFMDKHELIDTEEWGRKEIHFKPK